MSEDTPLSSDLQEYHKAISAEFRLAEVGTREEITKEARTKLYTLVPDALTALQRILINPDSDTAALRAINIVLDHSLGKPGSQNTTEDELDRIVSGLRQPVKAK